MMNETKISKNIGYKTLIVVSLLAAAVIVALLLESKYRKDLTETTTAAGGFNHEPHFDKEVRIGGSASVIPLMKIIAIEYQRITPDVNIKFLPDTHSRGGILSIHEGEADIGTVSRPFIKGEVNFKIKYLHLANDILVLATHHGVNIDNLTTRQIKEIYSGAITNWSEVGGPDQKIILLDRPEHTSPKIIMRKMVFGDDLVISTKAVFLERPWQMNESIKAIPYSIGYTSLGDIIRESLNLNVLKIDGVSPKLENVIQHRYNLIRPFGLTIGETPNKNTMQFIDFIYGDEGSRIIQNSGYVPMVMTLVIGTVPERNILKQEDRYKPLVEYLYRTQGIKVQLRLKHLSSYQQVVDEFLAGEVNSAFLGSLTYVLAKTRVGVTPIARPEINGISQYRGLILTRKDSGINSWEDLKGRSLAMIRATTAGEIFPKLYFKRRGIENLSEFLGSIKYVGSHDDSILEVLNGDVDAGAAKDLIFYKLAQEIPGLKEKVKILAIGFPVPENALTIRKDVDIKCFICHTTDGNIDKERTGSQSSTGGRLESILRKALLNLGSSEEGRYILRQFGADRFIETTDKDYQELYDSLEELGIDLNKY